LIGIEEAGAMGVVEGGGWVSWGSKISMRGRLLGNGDNRSRL